MDRTPGDNPSQRHSFSPTESLPLVQKTMRHNALKILEIVLTAVSFTLMAVFNGLAAATSGGGLFKNNTGDIANVFDLEITPAGWAFSVWGFIYAWQALWIVYALTTICRRKAGTYIYLMPLLPTVFYASYILNNLLNIGWLFAWDRQQIAIAFPLLALTTFTLYVCLFISSKRLYDNLDYLIRNGMTVEVWLMRFIVQNGIAFYAGWVTVATLINLGTVLTYKDGSDVTDIGVAQDVSSTIVLGILALAIVLWFILDIFVLDKYTRYTFSPYMTLLVALAGSVQKNFNLDTTRRNSIFSVILLAGLSVAFLIKLVTMIVRHFKRPIVPVSSDIKPLP